MSKPITTDLIPSNLLDHSAVKAWAALQPERAAPDGIEILKLKKKSAVYRLVGVGPDRSSVIAKRCRKATATLERTIYENVLPRLPLPSLRYFGHLEEPGGEFCWLFLESANGTAYAVHEGAHRALAASWLGAIQTAALTADLESRLPVHDADYYLGLLRSTRETLRQHLVNKELHADDLRRLETLAAQFDAIEAHWHELGEKCDGLPPTLVHGDFVTKNVRVHADATGLVLMVFDWEYAGWGVPATDLSQFIGGTVSPDLDVYGTAVSGPLRALAGRNARRLAECGKFFRLIDDLSWAASLLTFRSYLFLEKPMSYLKSYEPRMARALREANWDGEFKPYSHA